MTLSSRRAINVGPLLLLATVITVAIVAGAVLYVQPLGPAGASSSSSTTLSTSTSGSSQDLAIAGKVSVVICKEPAIMNASACNPPPDFYSSRQLVLTQSPSNPFSLPLNSDGSFTGRVPAGTYQVSITQCDFLGCNLPRPGNITVAASQDRNYSICFNCR
jgi:hypothetical protein